LVAADRGSRQFVGHYVSVTCHILGAPPFWRTTVRALTASRRPHAAHDLLSPRRFSEGTVEQPAAQRARKVPLKEIDMLRLWVDGIVILGSVTVMAVNGAKPADVATWHESLLDGAVVVMSALPWINDCGRLGFARLTQGAAETMMRIGKSL
jgi:hypothetical protein